MGGVLMAAAAMGSLVLNAGVGVAGAFIVKGATEKPEDGWIAFGILAALPFVCCTAQYWFWRRRARELSGEPECEVLCVAPACIFAPLGFLVGFLSAYLRLHFAPGINGRT